MSKEKDAQILAQFWRALPCTAPCDGWDTDGAQIPPITACACYIEPLAAAEARDCLGQECSALVSGITER